MGNISSGEAQRRIYTDVIAKTPQFQWTINSMDPEVECLMKNSVLTNLSQKLEKIEQIKSYFLTFHASPEEFKNITAEFLMERDHSRQKVGMIELDKSIVGEGLMEDWIRSAEAHSFPRGKGLSENGAKCCSLALSLYSSLPIRKEFDEGNNDYLGTDSFLNRLCDSASLPEDEASISTEDKFYFILFSYLLKALPHLKIYSEKASQALALSQQEQVIYKEGTVFTLKHFSIFSQGESPHESLEKENTRFIIVKSRTGRNVAPYSKDVVFSPGCTFMVISKEINRGITFIYLREVELGKSDDITLWVDERIDEENYEYNPVLDTIISQEVQIGISIVRKSSRTQAIAFLESPFAMNKNIKIITILRKLQKNQPIDQDALIEFLKKEKTFNVKPPFTEWLVQTRGEALECLFKEEEIECLDQNRQKKQAKLDLYRNGDLDSSDPFLSTNLTSENSKMINPNNFDNFFSPSLKEWSFNLEPKPIDLTNYESDSLGIRAHADEQTQKHP